VHLVGFITKKFVTMQHGHTMHGHMNVKFGKTFGKKMFSFSSSFVWNISHSKKESFGSILLSKMYTGLHVKYP
jgi:hypothetical protein